MSVELIKETIMVWVAIINDNKVVELAITSQSDYLVTSNTKDFKNAELKFDQLKAVTPADFAKIWRRENV